MKRRLVGSAAACLLVMAVGFLPRATADCALQALVPRMLTPTTASLPRDGGAIVVGLRSSPEAAGAPMPQSIALVRGRRTQSLVSTQIAPGLVRFAATSRLLPGPFTTSQLGAPITLTVGRSPMPGVPTRPVLREMRRVSSTGMSASRTPRAEVRATLEFPVPAGIVAIVTYWGESGGPAWWAPAIQGQTEIVAWTEPGRCEQPIEGTSGPGEGAVGRIAYVDQFGQLSPISASVPVP